MSYNLLMERHNYVQSIVFDENFNLYKVFKKHGGGLLRNLQAIIGT